MWRGLTGGIAAAALALACVSAAAASPGLRGGITDSGAAYFHDPADFYPALEELGVQLLRVHLNWGGKLGVATRRPRRGHGLRRSRLRLAPLRPRSSCRRSGTGSRSCSRSSARRRGRTAAAHPRARRATRRGCASSPTRPRPATAARTSAADGTLLPRVRYWTAWNEPNLQIGLIPQWRRVGKPLGDPERGRLRAHLQRGRRRSAHVDAARPEGRLRRHRGPRQQQPERHRSRPSPRSRSFVR